MKLYLSLMCSLFVLFSCEYNPKQVKASVYPNYYDSLYHNAYLKTVRKIDLTESLENQGDDFALSSSFLNGVRTINIFKELEIASRQDKPLLIYFTSHGCANCIRMDQLILSNKDISSYLVKEFHFIPLNTDDRTRLPETHWVKHPDHDISKRSKYLMSIGSVNSWVQVALSRSGSQPLFIGLDNNRKLGDASYTANEEAFLLFLKGIVESYKLD